MHMITDNKLDKCKYTKLYDCHIFSICIILVTNMGACRKHPALYSINIVYVSVFK